MAKPMAAGRCPRTSDMDVGREGSRRAAGPRPLSKGAWHCHRRSGRIASKLCRGDARLRDKQAHGRRPLTVGWDFREIEYSFIISTLWNVPEEGLVCRPPSGRLRLHSREPGPTDMSAPKQRGWTVVALTAPAYLWLAVTVLLPLSAMLFFSFLTVAPFGLETPALTFGQLPRFHPRGFPPDPDRALPDAGGLGHPLLPAPGLPGCACAGQARQGPLARGAVPAHRAAVLEQRAWCASFPGPWCCARTG